MRNKIDLENEADTQTTQWLDIASGIDSTARILIRYCLALAAQSVVDKSREWIALAEAITKEDDIDTKVVRIIIDDSDTLNSENPDDSEKKKIEGLIKRLEGFSHLASMLSSHFHQQLDQATPQRTS